jgi:hypothetical protein
MKLTPEQIQDNWNELIRIIETNISSPRKEKLLEFYEQYAERLMLMPASHKKEYHNAFPGGYVEHVLRVIRCANKQYNLWEDEGADMSTFTTEELIFSALNHDLGKIGDEENESYIPQTDNWRREKLGEDYMFNEKIPFASVPDRGLFLLQSYGIQYTFNEMIAIQTHDGLYDEGNKKYLVSFIPGQKPRTSLPYILHQADLMASRIEFEREWLPKLKGGKKSVDAGKENFTLGNKPNMSKKTSTKTKALGTFKSDSLKNILDNL